MEILALRLVKVPSLPRWYALGVLLYLGEQRQSGVTGALLRFAVDTADPERRRCAVEAIGKIADPNVRTKVEAERARVARIGGFWPPELDHLVGL